MEQNNPKINCVVFFLVFASSQVVKHLLNVWQMMQTVIRDLTHFAKKEKPQRSHYFIIYQKFLWRWRLQLQCSINHSAYSNSTPIPVCSSNFKHQSSASSNHIFSSFSVVFSTFSVITYVWSMIDTVQIIASFVCLYVVFARTRMKVDLYTI